MVLRRLWIFALVAIALLAGIASLRQPSASASGAANNGKRVPVVVELFTSEGCSDCPPADALLQRLAETQPVPGAEIIVLANHVDYWNHMGWTDKFSSHQFSERQSEYGDVFRLDSVYTPQMVVDGKSEFNGADERRAKSAIAVAIGDMKTNIALTSNGSDPDPRSVPLKIQIDAAPASSKDVAVILAITEDHLQSSVQRGENGGRTLNHTGVVRDLRVIGSLKSGGFSANPSIKLSSDWKPQDLHAIVFLQDTHTRNILGAASLVLAKK
jgi:hypothetical protein